MLDVLFEQRATQNTALAAEALWQATAEAFEASSRTGGVLLPAAFLVLPLTFHRRSALALATKTQPGAIYKALAEDREILVGLQSRLEAMSQRTFDGLSIAFHSDLLRLDSDRRLQLLPGRKSPPVTHASAEVKTILSAAKRVGQALVETPLIQLSAHLGVKF